MTLTIELEKSDNPEIAICFDLEGLNVLISKLEYLRSKIDHIHLMTPSWAGNELTEKLHGGDEYWLIHSLRLVRLPEPKRST